MLNEKGECVKDLKCLQPTPIPPPPPKNCSFSEGYRVDGAYRLVPGTRCDPKRGKVDYRDKYDCPTVARFVGLDALVLMAIFSLIGFTICLGIVLYYRNRRVQEFLRSKFPGFFAPTQDMKGFLEQDLFDDDDELFSDNARQ